MRAKDDDQPVTRKVKRGKQVYEMKKKQEKAPEVQAKTGEGAEALIAGATTVGISAEVALTVAKALSKASPKDAVSFLVITNVAMQPMLPSPESAVGMLRDTESISPQRLINIAKWYEGIAFSLEA